MTLLEITLFIRQILLSTLDVPQKVCLVHTDHIKENYIMMEELIINRQFQDTIVNTIGKSRILLII